MEITHFATETLGAITLFGFDWRSSTCWASRCVGELVGDTLPFETGKPVSILATSDSRASTITGRVVGIPVRKLLCSFQRSGSTQNGVICSAAVGAQFASMGSGRESK